MRILKSIIAIFVVVGLAIGIFVYTSSSENVSAVSNNSVIINEFMASNKSTIADETGNYGDWIELYNPTDQPVDLSGIGLSNDKTEVKWAFPRIMLQPGGYLVVFMSGKSTSNSDALFQHVNFKLKAAQGGVYLTNASGQVIDQIEYKDQASDVSMGRDAADMAQWISFEQATPGFSNDEAGLASFKQSRVMDDAKIMITEVMSSNQTTLADNNGVFSDYIEIYNADSEAVSLAGFALSDNPDNMAKWRFPDVTIEPGAYMIVFASGEDAKSTDVETGAVHTSFRISAYEETIVLANPMGLIMDEVVVSELGTDVAYGRVLQADGTYADAWEQTNLPSPGYQNDTQGHTQFNQGNEIASGPVIISEVMIANSEYLQEDDGEYYDWIELYNRSSESVDLTGYALTDDPGYPTKYTFAQTTLAPGQYLTVLASGLKGSEDEKKKYIHTNFKLNAQGELLALYDNNTKLQDRYNITNLPRGVSVGRKDGENVLFYYDQPTPNAANGSPHAGVLTAPTPLTPGGSYDGAQQVALTSKIEGATITYTRDGTTPTRSSTAYTSPISVEKTGVIRAKAFKDGYIESDVSSNTYVIGAQHSLPVVSLVTDPDNLFDPVTGIYELGSDPVLIEGSTSHYEQANYLERGQESERPASFEVFDESGAKVFAQNIAVRIQGGFSRDAAQKSFSIFARPEYGSSMMAHSFFDNREFTEYKSLILRQGGQDQSIAKIKEITALSLVEGQGFNYLTQAYKPYVLYLNGEYWGVYFMMEKRNEYFIAQHEGTDDPDNMNVMKATSILMEGSREGYMDLLDYIKTHDMSQKEHFEYVAARLDTDSFMDEMISEIWVANSDYANMQFYQILPDGKWKQIYYDFCWTFGSSAYPNASHPTVQRRMDDDVTGSTVFTGLLSYKPFRDQYIERFAWAMKEIYNTERVLAVIDTAADLVRDEMAAERAKFGGTFEGWEKNVEKMREFARHRNNQVVDQLIAAFSLSSDQIEMLREAIE